MKVNLIVEHKNLTFLKYFSFIKIAILYQVTPIFIQYENSFGLLFNDIYFYQIAMMRNNDSNSETNRLNSLTNPAHTCFPLILLPDAKVEII
mgnify:FL=1